MATLTIYKACFSIQDLPYEFLAVEGFPVSAGVAAAEGEGWGWRVALLTVGHWLFEDNYF